MYLLDTNIWLERLLDQERSAEVGEFLQQTPSEELMISDFSLHSIGVILSRLGKQGILPEFIDDLFINGNIHLGTTPPEEMSQIVEIMERFRLDFDDAYQYVVAQRYDAIIVSFDGDFDRTEQVRKTPAMLLENEY